MKYKVLKVKRQNKHTSGIRPGDTIEIITDEIHIDFLNETVYKYWLYQNESPHSKLTPKEVDTVLKNFQLEEIDIF